MKDVILMIAGFFVGFVFTALVSPHADWTINQVMKKQKVEVNQTYLDSIATLKQELNYQMDLVRTKEHERFAYELAGNACKDMLAGSRNEVEFYHKLFLNNTKLKAIKLDTLIITKEN